MGKEILDGKQRLLNNRDGHSMDILIYQKKIEKTFDENEITRLQDRIARKQAKLEEIGQELRNFK